MRYFIRLLAAVYCALAGLHLVPAAAEKRVALVIGNAQYQHTRVLPNPRNDAEAIAKLLHENGFTDVTLKTDLTYRTMRDELRTFAGKAGDADTAVVVYYAGHGIEVAGENYLIPTDAKLARDIDLEYEAITLASVLSAVSDARKLKLVILDACRNNPLGDKIALRAGVTRQASRGLTRIEPKGDVLVAYSAKAGTLAMDGKGKHSPYAEALLSTLATPGLDIRLVMGRVRDLVLAKTGGVQESFVYGSLGGANVALVSLKPGDVTDAAPDSIAARDYDRTANIGTKEAWDAFLAAHPSGFHAELARAQRLKLTTTTTKSDSPVTASPAAKSKTKTSDSCAAHDPSGSSRRKPRNLHPRRRRRLPDRSNVGEKLECLRTRLGLHQRPVLPRQFP
jgi:uncharacterized caspase-like protein